jgi:hypothetical protein
MLHHCTRYNPSYTVKPPAEPIGQIYLVIWLFGYFIIGFWDFGILRFWGFWGFWGFEIGVIRCGGKIIYICLHRFIPKNISKWPDKQQGR